MPLCELYNIKEEINGRYNIEVEVKLCSGSGKMATLAPPVRVSPLIKFGRWAALLTGIIYGRSHFKSLSAKEAILREEEAKHAVIRNAQLAEEKNRLNRGEMIYLAEQAGVPVPPNF
ncbi:ATP synthase subunit e, mitochondrial [Cherax quadricarinatus]|uniref:ATP synthase subunit e, mitochondrial n=1 Tax=Cherax quadricarinatus TaxID=27406 RepID=UPI0023796C91|nr:ATP synthase subunit e, mitochondrial-like [Cherax quadricarinatus]